MRNLFLVLFLFLLSSCGEELNYRLPSANEINIYIVKDRLEVHDTDFDLEGLKLEQPAWIKNSEILFYDWSAHAFYLKNEVEKEKYSARHFVVSSNDKRLFTGVFFPMHFSSIPMLPSIIPEDGWFSPKDVVRFGQFGYHYSGNLDNNTEFKQALIDAGIFREGIDVTLNKLKRIDAATLEYTFTVTNLEQNSIYVLDPDRMGASRFHYFTNGPGLKQGDVYYWASDTESTATDEIKTNWYKKLTSGSSMTRTLKLKGYSNLPNGIVEATFRFPGSNLIKSGSWKKSNGRIWIGEFAAEGVLEVE